MKNDFRKLGIILPAALLSLVAVVLRSVAAVRDMDSATGFYGGSPLVTISDLLMTAAAAVLMISLFIRVGNPSLRGGARSLASYVSSGVIAISALLIAVDLVLYISSQTRGGFIDDMLANRSSAVALLAALLAVAAAVLSVLSVFLSEARTSLRGICDMATALFFGIYATFLFFRLGDTINQPQKVVTEMAALAMAVFMLECARLCIGRERPGAYLALGTVTAALSANAFFPALAVCIFRGEVIAFSVYEMILTGAIFAFALLRLATVIGFKKVEELAADAEDGSEISAEDALTAEERQISDEENSGN